jgi:hypothetical protein
VDITNFEGVFYQLKATGSSILPVYFARSPCRGRKKFTCHTGPVFSTMRINEQVMAFPGTELITGRIFDIYEMEYKPGAEHVELFSDGRVYVHSNVANLGANIRESGVEVLELPGGITYRGAPRPEDLEKLTVAWERLKHGIVEMQQQMES